MSRQLKVKMRMNKKLEQYMSKNYKLEIFKDEDEIGYAAMHPELKGCITCAESIEKAVENLEDAKREWIMAAIADGIDIPEPDCDENDLESLTGSFDIQIDPDVYLKAILKADEKGISLNEYVEEAIRQAVDSKE